MNELFGVLYGFLAYTHAAIFAIVATIFAVYLWSKIFYTFVMDKEKYIIFDNELEVPTVIAVTIAVYCAAAILGFFWPLFYIAGLPTITAYIVRYYIRQNKQHQKSMDDKIMEHINDKIVEHIKNYHIGGKNNEA